MTDLASLLHEFVALHSDNFCEGCYFAHETTSVQIRDFKPHSKDFKLYPKTAAALTAFICKLRLMGYEVHDLRGKTIGSPTSAFLVTKSKDGHDYWQT